MPQKRIYSSNAERQRAYRLRVQQTSPAWEMGAILPDRSPLPNVPSEKRWRVLIDSALKDVLKVEEEMDDYGTERSDTWHESEKAGRFTERMLAVSEVREALETLLDEAFT